MWKAATAATAARGDKAGREQRSKLAKYDVKRARDSKKVICLKLRIKL